MSAHKYLFWKALRPFSFPVAVVVCLTGIVAANNAQAINLLSAALVLSAGLLLQAGVNLINDYSDLSILGSELDMQSRQCIRKNFQIGLICLFLAAIIALFLIYQSGWVLLLYAMIGLVGALGYTLEPLNYKRRGWAVFLVFWLMGVLMVTGTYYSLTQALHSSIFLISVPVSFYTSLLLLSNELRDYESDAKAGMTTLTVRLGYKRAAFGYQLLLVAIYTSALLMTVTQHISHAWLVLFSLPIALLPLKYLHLTAAQRKPITPLTAKAFMLFGILYCIALVISG